MTRRADKTGRSKKGGKFVALPEFVLASPGYRAASPIARALLVEILRVFNGTNNGRITMGVRDGGKLIGMSKNTVARALHELQEKGLIEAVVEGRFSPFSPLASEWRVTWHSCSVTRALPSKAFVNFAPKNLKSSPTHGTVQSHGWDSKAAKDGSRSHPWDSNDHSAVIPSPTHGTHIDIYHMKGAALASAVAANQKAGDQALASEFNPLGDVLARILTPKATNLNGGKKCQLA